MHPTRTAAAPGASQRALRRTVAVAATVVMLLALSGCFKLDMNLKVNSDDTLDGTVVFAIDKDLSEMAGGQDTDLKPEDLPKGATVEKYDQDGFVGQKITLHDVSMSDLDTSFSSEGDTGSPGQWKLTHERDEYHFTGDMDMTDLAADQNGGMDMSAFMKSAELRVSLTFPGEVTDSNGKIDGNTVTWEPKIGEKNDMNAVAKDSSGFPTLLVAGIAAAAVLLLLVAAGVLLLVRARRTPQQPEQVAAPVGREGLS